MSSIREALEALADAIEEALESGQTADSTPTPKKGQKSGKSKPTAKAKTMDDVRNALVELNSEHGKSAVVDVLSRFGITKVGDLDDEHFDECIRLAENYVEEFGKGDDEEEEEAPAPKKRGKKAPPPEDEEEEEDEDEEEEEAPPPRRRRK